MVGYRPFLDGVRSLAVYLVVLFHAGVGRAAGGFIGVDVFFVLSGYLVTQVLVRDSGWVGWGAVWAVLRAAVSAVVAGVVCGVGVDVGGVWVGGGPGGGGRVQGVTATP
jgi:hypothetical protein